MAHGSANPGAVVMATLPLLLVQEEGEMKLKTAQNTPLSPLQTSPFPDIHAQDRKGGRQYAVYWGAEDTPDHTVMRCVRWENDRDSVLWRREAGAGFTVRSLVELMTGDAEKWREAAGIISKIMMKKEEEAGRRRARIRQGEGDGTEHSRRDISEDVSGDALRRIDRLSNKKTF